MPRLMQMPTLKRLKQKESKLKDENDAWLRLLGSKGCESLDSSWYPV